MKNTYYNSSKYSNNNYNNGNHDKKDENVNDTLERLREQLNEYNDKNKNNGAKSWFTTALFIVFLVLKLCGVITWPWVWVCAPLWIPIALVFVILIVALLFALVASFFDY